MAGLDEDISVVAFHMPTVLGFVEQQRLVLVVRALVYVKEAQQLLSDWARVLGVAYERWRDDGDNARMRRSDVVALVGGDEDRATRVSQILFRESWALGSGHGAPEDEWEREIHSGVRSARPRGGAPVADLLAARTEAESGGILTDDLPPPSVLDRLPPVVRSPRRLWRAISNNLVWSAVVAAVIAGVLLNFILGSDGDGSGKGSSDHPAQTTPPTTSNGQTNTAESTPQPAPQGKTVREQAGASGARTYSDPHTLNQPGQQIEPGAFVRVSCRIYSPEPASVRPDGWWYRIASPPFNNRAYAPANSFWNGDRPGKRPYTHNTDFKVPECS